MKTTVRRSAEGLTVLIPNRLAALANLIEDAEVELRVRGGQIIIDPVGTGDLEEHVTLEDLVARITPENLHDGREVGPEGW